MGVISTYATRVVGTSNLPHSSLFSHTLRCCINAFHKQKNPYVHIGHQSCDTENEAKVLLSKCSVDACYPDWIVISRITIHSSLVWTGLNRLICGNTDAISTTQMTSQAEHSRFVSTETSTTHSNHQQSSKTEDSQRNIVIAGSVSGIFVLISIILIVGSFIYCQRLKHTTTRHHCVHHIAKGMRGRKGMSSVSRLDCYCFYNTIVIAMHLPACVYLSSSCLSTEFLMHALLS